MTTAYTTWENQLNNLGLFANIEKLTAHLNTAPKTTNAEEIETINLVKKVVETRNNGGDLTKINQH